MTDAEIRHWQAYVQGLPDVYIAPLDSNLAKDRDHYNRMLEECVEKLGILRVEAKRRKEKKEVEPWPGSGTTAPS